MTPPPPTNSIEENADLNITSNWQYLTSVVEGLLYFFVSFQIEKQFFCIWNEQFPNSFDTIWFPFFRFNSSSSNSKQFSRKSISSFGCQFDENWNERKIKLGKSSEMEKCQKYNSRLPFCLIWKKIKFVEP